jgi:hypothetical protein
MFILWNKALAKFQINSKFFWDFHHSFVEGAQHNRVKVAFMPNQKETEGNETADE